MPLLAAYNFDADLNPYRISASRRLLVAHTLQDQPVESRIPLLCRERGQFCRELI